MAASSGPKGLPDICVSAATLPNVPTTTAKTSWDAWQGIFDNLPGTFRGLVPMRAGGGRNQGASQLYGGRSLLSQTFAIGALMLPNVAWGQVTETLPEVTVSAPRPAPVRRATPAPPPAPPSRPAPPRRVPPPAPSSPPSPPPAPHLPAFQAVATTPVTGLGIDRDKVPAMVQTLPAADFSRNYSPNVVETFAQRIPG